MKTQTIKQSEENKIPQSGELVGIHYILSYQGQELDNTYKKKQVFEFIAGDDQLIPCIEEAVMSMRVGEISDFKLVSSGKLVLHPSVPEKAELDCRIELLFSNKSKQFRGAWDLTLKEKYESALRLKDSGNILFKEGDFKDAKKKYKLALYTLKNDEGKMSTEDDATKQLAVQCYINLATCELKYDEAKSAVENCTKALHLDTDNIKALYRRGQAYLNLQEYENCRKDLQLAQSKCKDAATTKAIQTEIEKLKKEENAYQSKMKKMYSGMFDSK